MKAYRVHEFGGPDSLKLEDLPDPKPGPGQVLVRMRAASLNYRDLMVVKGQYSRGLPLPLIPLSDGAGEVAEVGPGASKFRPGDRVTPIFMQGWIEGDVNEAKMMTGLGGAIDGVLAEAGVFAEEGLVRVPDHLGHEEAACLPCAGVTAWHALMTYHRVRPGESVLVLGTGGVSIFALQFAKLAGARVIATSSSDQKLERARQLGASEGINYKTNPDWDARVRELTGGVGVDHVVEVGGVGTLGKSLRAVRMGGHVPMIGVLTGAAAEFNAAAILMRSADVRGIFVGSRVMFEDMDRAIAFHQMRPVVDRVFPFAEAREAYKYLESGAHFGKVVIRF